jgi:hypothetical protein
MTHPSHSAKPPYLNLHDCSFMKDDIIVYNLTEIITQFVKGV